MLDENFLSELNDLYVADGNERCGYVEEGHKIVEFENVHPDPKNGFEASLEDTEVVENNEKVTHLWHTQPGRLSQLSYEDNLGFLNFPEFKHIVIGCDGVRVYRVENGAVVKDSLHLR